MGGAAMVAGIAGIVVWINDGTRAFDVAVAVASAGLLTLVSCVLARVFGSSHGSQDDAFERGRSMGYDAGFLEGHRTARPVVVPLRDTDHAGGLAIPPATMPLWGRDEMPPSRSHALRLSPRALRERLVAWAGDKRAPKQQRAGDRRTPILQWAEDKQNPILAGALCLALVGVLVAGLAVRMPAAVDALAGPSGSLFHRAVSPSGQTPAPADESASSPTRATTAGGSPFATAAPDATGEPGALGGSGGSGGSVGSGGVGESGTSAAGAGGVAGRADTAAASSLPNLPGASGGGAVVPAVIHVPAPASSASTPPVVAAPHVPVVAAPAVPLTAAQQTAADASAAAALTAANASAAAALTAANAKSAAELTAATAAAAAAATAQAAADAAWAVAHPQP
jgi:hypothetical protein